MTKKNSIKHILENPSEYSTEMVQRAEFMEKKLDEHGTLKYDKEGFDALEG